MERDPVSKQFGDQVYTLIWRTREDLDFFCHLGPFASSRAVVRALGMPMYNDEHRVWCFILNANQKTVACGSLEQKPRSRIAALKSTYVEPEERGKGLYDWMFACRLQLAEERHVKKITSTTTEKSKHTHERYGFRFVGMRGKYYTFWKE